jgi:membrane protein
MTSVSKVGDVTKHVFSDVSEKNVTFMAAGIAYNAFVSLAPMLLLLLLVVSVFGRGAEQQMVAVAGSWLPGPIAEVVQRVLEGSSTGASVVGLLVLVWGTLKIFRGLDTAFSEIYETEAENSFVDQVKDGLVVLVALVVAILATALVSAAFAAFEGVIPHLEILTPLVLVAGLVLAFLPMYYRFPDADVGVADVVPGVVFAAVFWALFQVLFQVYLGFKNPGSSGFFGSVIVVVTYLYFSGLVLLVGAVINAVLGGHSAGSPGGLGRGATSTDVERRESMDRDELAAYLGRLRADLSGRHEGMRPAAADTDTDAADLPRPVDDVEVVEHTTTDGDGTRRAVTLRWRGSDARDEGD